MGLHNWLISKGFAPFIEVGNPTHSYENKTLGAGGIRVEVCQDVATVWMPSKRYAEHHWSRDVPNVIDTLLR